MTEFEVEIEFGLDHDVSRQEVSDLETRGLAVPGGIVVMAGVGEPHHVRLRMTLEEGDWHDAVEHAWRQAFETLRAVVGNNARVAFRQMTVTDESALGVSALDDL